VIQSSRTASWLVLALVAAAASAPVRAQAGDDKSQREATRLIPNHSSWSLRLPKETQVVYKGVASFDGAGAAGHPIMYPAPNIAGFLAAVITHGVVVESVQARQRKQIQDAADRVLSHYEPALRDYSHRTLMEKALDRIGIGDSKKVVESTAQPGADWLIDSSPVFAMTQDRRALVLENSVAIFSPDAPATGAYRNTIKVVSDVHESSDFAAFWGDNEAEKLKNESAQLLAHSLEIAMREAVNSQSKEGGVQRTFRYREGGTEKMERGELISERCNRTIIRNLRGWIMSIPAASSPSAPGDGCGVPSR
jgi:hypothetical protein